MAYPFVTLNGPAEAKMSFHTSHLTMAVLFFLVFLASDCVGEWIPVSSTPLHKVPFGNTSTKLFRVHGVGFDYGDEFSCAKIHNLTMLGYAKREESSGTFDWDGNGNFLGELRAKLQRQIEGQIMNLGLDRRARTYHIGFPSLEGALVSISLLLFAVYLIKLVMKVVYTFHTKRGTTEYVGFLSNLRQPIVIAPNRQKRGLDLDMESMKLQMLFEEQISRFN